MKPKSADSVTFQHWEQEVVDKRHLGKVQMKPLKVNFKQDKLLKTPKPIWHYMSVTQVKARKTSPRKSC